MNPNRKSSAAELSEATQRLQALLDSRDLAAATTLSEEIQLKVKKAGWRSAYLKWVLAVVADYSGKHLAAHELIEEAIDLDPLPPPFHNSRTIIHRRLREALCDPAREAADPETPRIWEALVRAEAADDACHLALARFHLAKGNALEALRIADSVTALSPANGAAWAMKGQIARQLGDEKLAILALAEATALGERPSNFGPLVVAQG